MARKSKISALMRRVIDTPDGGFAVHRAAMSRDGLAQAKTADGTSVVIFTRAGGQGLRFKQEARNNSKTEIKPKKRVAVR
ncbi:hypothetical protein [Deinococcus sp. NW-56]|uniref:hypothetical protein n=1 Tax=Deinococcus sp. NW-56 TaxID=2080419 RepID=UPI000CF4C983|nr:hypothetical protein [Deinococcus sp. NW-56]